MKDYIAHVQFNAVEVRVRANTKAEARRKIREKVAKKNPAKLIDRGNLFIDRFID